MLGVFFVVFDEMWGGGTERRMKSSFIETLKGGKFNGCV